MRTVSLNVDRQVRPEPPILGLARMRVALKSADVAFIDEGSGPCVLLLHGAPATSIGFVRVIRELRKTCRVIAPDLPGFGGSRSHHAALMSLRDYADFVEEFCDALGLSGFFIFGTDSSASIGLAAATRLADDVDGLIIADTVPIPLTGRAWLIRMVLRYIVTSPPVSFVNSRFNLLPWLVANVAPLKSPLTRQERRKLVEQYDTAAKRDLILHMFGEMARDVNFMRQTAEGVRGTLDQKPALILMGQFDPVRFVGGISRFQNMFPRHKVAIIRWEEHFPILASGRLVAIEIDRFAREVWNCSSTGAG